MNKVAQSFFSSHLQRKSRHYVPMIENCLVRVWTWSLHKETLVIATTPLTTVVMYLIWTGCLIFHIYFIPSSPSIYVTVFAGHAIQTHSSTLAVVFGLVRNWRDIVA